MRIFRGLNVTFSWKRAVGITALKRKVSKATHVPTTKMGLHAKIGRMATQLMFGKPKSRRGK